MSNLKVDFENVNLNERKILSYANKVEEIHNKTLIKKMNF